MRLVVLLLTIASLLSLQAAAWPWQSQWYRQEAVRPGALNQLEGALHAGIFSNMLYVHATQRKQSFPVNRQALQQAQAVVEKANRHAVTAMTEQTKHGDVIPPDIVMILSESFMDPRVLNGMGKVQDVVPNFRRVMQAGYASWMRVPTFGGGTVRTEFEALTGMPVAAFSGVQYPYVDLVLNRLPGLVSELKTHGYATLAVHGNSGSFWNRTTTYQVMGVDHFITQRDFRQRGLTRDGVWYADQGMTEIILQELQQKIQPTFVFAASIQAHGPYTGEQTVADPIQRNAIQVPRKLTDLEAEEFRNYLYHIQQADTQFERLLVGLQARGRPFVLLFFSDHLPAFESPIYEQLLFKEGGEASEQRVPWLIVKGDASGVLQQISLPDSIFAWELPGIALQTAGLSESAYIQFTQALAEQLRTSETTSAGVLWEGLEAAARAQLEGKFDAYAE